MLTPESIAAVGTEHAHQVAYFMWAAMTLTPEVNNVLFAIPNGGYRDPKTAGNLKAEGVKAGVGDVFLAQAVWPYHGLFMEFKVPGDRSRDKRQGKASPAQIIFRKAVMDNDFAHVIVVGWESARDTTNLYLKGEL